MSEGRLERECRTYGRYLIGREPAEYVAEKYREYHARCGPKVAPADSFDRFLSDISARSPFWTRLADVYASRFVRQAAVRKKLVLMLALLECSPESFAYLDAVDGGGSGAALLRLAGRAAVYAGALPLAIVLLTPVHAFEAVFARSGKVPAVES